ncbi:MAG TPA: ECF-type sigma factor [Gemmata sp.]|jgi:RNA polymerase sigma factor (TIGR02999 family)|nr:ECF-type sigma factor [Gemmata sp.]
MSDVSRLLDLAQAGDRKAAAELLPLVYDELRKLAAAKMALEKPGHTLDATALVHEAYLRLTGEQSFESRSHFMRAAAEAMRRILVDYARAKQAEKRGGELNRVPLSEIPANSPDIDLIALDDALVELEKHDPVAAELVKLRYFSGFSHGEAAEILGLTRRQADGLWALARAWLFRRLRSDS